MSGTPQKKKHLLLSTLSSQSQQDGPIHDLVPSPTSQETWMASSGRLRIGPTGIPLKFQMGKVTQARSILREEASSTSASSSLPLSPHRLERGSESMLPPGSPTVGPGVGEGGGVGGAVGLDKLLTHQLHLLSTLVGPEVLTTLDVDDLFQSPVDAKVAAIASATEGAEGEGFSLLRLDESRLPLHLFDAFDTRGELEELAARGVGREGKAPYYQGSAAGWGWKDVRVLSVDVEGGLIGVEFTETGKKKSVRRLDLCLSGEDVGVFGRRVAAAMKAREACKSGLRFQHLVDTLALPQDCAPVQDAWLARIYSRALAAKASFSTLQGGVALEGAKRLDPRAAEEADEREAAEAVARLAAIAAVTPGGALSLAAASATAAAAGRVLPSGGAPGRTLLRGGGGGGGGGKRGDGKLSESSSLPDSSDEEAEGGGGAAAHHHHHHGSTQQGGGGGGKRAALSTLGLPPRPTPAQLLAHASCDPYVTRLFSEVVFEYDYSVKAGVINDLLTRAAESTGRAVEAGLAPGTLPLGSTSGLKSSTALEGFTCRLAAKFSRLRLPDPPTPPTAPLHAKLTQEEVGYDTTLPGTFGATRSVITQGVALSHPRTVKALTALYNHWGSSVSSPLGGEASTFLDTRCTTALALPTTVKEYQRFQQAHAGMVRDKLVKAWPREVCHNLLDALPPGLFDVYEQKWEAYYGAPLHRLLRRTESMMTFILRDLALRSITSLHDFVASYIPHPTLDKCGVGGWTTSFKRPLFTVELTLKRVVDKDVASESGMVEGVSPGAATPPLFDVPLGSYAVQQSPSRPDVYRALLGTLVALSEGIGGVPGIQRGVMGLLKFPEAGKGEAPMERLLTIGGGTPVTEDIDRRIREAKGSIRNILAHNLLSGCALLCRRFQGLAWLAECDKVGSVVDAILGEAQRVAKEKAAAAEAERVKAAAEAKAGEAAKKAGEKERGVKEEEDKPAPVVLELVANAPNVEHIFTHVQRFHAAAEFAMCAADDVEDMGLLRVSTSGLKSTLASRALECRDALLKAILSHCAAESQSITANYEHIIERLQQRPKNEQELLAAKAFLRNSEAVCDFLQSATEAIHGRAEHCGRYAYQVPPDDIHLHWSLKEWPLRVALITREMLEALEADRAAMIAALDQAKAAFQSDLEVLEVRSNSFKDAGAGATDINDTESLAELGKVVARANDLDGVLRASMDKGEDINERERAFGFPPTAYTSLKSIQEDFDPFFRLWLALAEFVSKKDTWITSSLLEVNAGEVEKDVTDWWTMSYRQMKTLGDAYPGAMGAAKALRGGTDEFKKNVPLLRCLASKALEPRHWVAISNCIGKDVNPREEDLTLRDLLALGVLDKFEGIEEVAVQAEKEHSLKKALDAMKKEWDTITFDIVPYKATGTFVIKGTDEVNQLLDDQIVKAQTMMGSPYIKPNVEECSRWEKLLVTVQQVMEEWVAVQRTWLYLEPIFASEDIMRQMPQEGRRFAQVDKIFRVHMLASSEDPKALVAAGKDGLLTKLKEANKLLDAITKGLNEYLELKRLAFPRFFFLSNDELLEILSQTKDPRAAQPHLAKCFEGIAKVTFRAEKAGLGAPPTDMTIIEMISSEGEMVPLVKFVDPDAPKAKGNVEVWFTDLQTSMRLTVKDVVRQSLNEYPKQPRKDWVLNWPGQLVLNVSQLFWTQEVEAALNAGGLEGLKGYEAQLNGQLQDIVALVRGKLSKMGRTTLGALTTIDVHARDVITDMISKGVYTVTDFNWMAQLRYAYEHRPDEGYNRYGEDPMNLQAKIVNAVQLYGYEYLGNSSRLVITPLTDRCYRTLMSAVYLTYGGAPAGPAGTGKTETTKDLAKAMGIACVVFNCSDGLDYLAMGKFFKGLAAAGAWACFDEFNRIELEVLSVVAQQVLTVQKAKRARVAKFVFEGTTLPLNPDANAFITMNPGYAGRSELPDNLKALFRPVSMMVPDYALISEIKLYSFGFGDARNMAQKLTQVLRLSSEQLSSQKHYDYGMRAVFSILIRAGNLRQALGDDPNWSEERIVLSAVQDVNVPKFTTNDLPLFKGITSDLFPGVVLPTPDYNLLMRYIKSACLSFNMQAKDEFVKSVIQLFETVAVRHGLMLVGETGCGKTTVLRNLQLAMSTIAKEHPDTDFLNVQIHTLNPKSITQGQLYGNFDENTHEWTDGVLAITYRNCARDTGPDRHWVMFDGPVDAVWIENMNTVLDDNKKLCLNSGEIIKMSPTMTMMYETDNLQEASPATVSRCGMVFMEPRRMGWRPMVQSWLATLPRALDAYREPILALFEWLLPPMLAFALNFVRQLTPVSELHLTHSLLSMLQCLLERTYGCRVCTSARGPEGSFPSDAADEKEEREAFAKLGDAPKTPADVAKCMEGLFLQSIVWTVGAVTDVPGRAAFSAYLRAMLAGKQGGEAAWKDFRSKNPQYDGHCVGPAAGQASRAADGDIREFDHNAEAAEAAAASRDPSLSAEAAAVGILEQTASRYYLVPLSDGEGGAGVRVATIPFPEEDTVYEWVFVPSGKGGGVWKSWMVGVPKYEVPQDGTYTSIIVPTVDTIRSGALLDLLVLKGKHVLCVGETGTGKSVTLRQKLMNDLPAHNINPIFLNFSAQTSANQTQDIIDGKMSRRRKGVFGPVMGTKFVVFVDDLNMPSKEKYGAQPPIEILRQWMDHGGWYDRRDKDQAFMELVDIQFVAAMGPPGGGRTRISSRYQRHFNVLSFVPFDDGSLGKVFNTIISWCIRDFSSGVKACAAAVVTATVDIYNSITKEMLPTPAKSHYTFNLRDLSKVFQGMNQASAKKISEGNQYFRLWAHECYRVFYDRLTTEGDRKWFSDALAERVKEHFKKDWTRDIKGPHPTLIYGNFVDQKANVYEELADRTALANTMATFLEDYNAMSASQLTLVLFGYAVEHVARISRIINQPGGNALLVGVGGSGRKSLCTLATFMAQFKIFSVEITKAYGMTEWRDDLKKVLIQAGAAGKDTVFLFSDTQIVKETFVEDINNVLNNGEVPNLFAADERAQICGDVQVAAKKEGKSIQNNTEAYAYFIDRVKVKLHVVLCFSPIGDAFRRRLRMFPSLVNCTTIDWFTPWPEEGLRSVAHAKMEGVDLPGADPVKVKDGVIDVCVAAQLKVTELSTRFLTQLKRYYYVTPTSYLELISSFRELIGKKRKEILTAKARYENGLEKIVSTESMVDGMKADLTALQPQLVKASAETDVMIKEIEVVSADVGAKAVIVERDAAVCAEQAAAANAIATDCAEKLAEAEPILEAAKKAVANLSKADVGEMRGFKVASKGVLLTAEAMCLVFKVKPKKVPNPAGKGPKVDDWWEPCKAELLGKAEFMSDLMHYDTLNIDPAIITSLEPLMARSGNDEKGEPMDFHLDTVAKSSKAAAGLACWVQAVFKFDKVARVVAPKRAALAQAQSELDAANAMLAGKQEDLGKLKANEARLKAELQEAVDKKDKLMRDVETCANRLDRAQRLIGGLGGEKVRWGVAAAALQAQFDNIVGDVLLSASMIAYLGAFTSAYREEAIKDWSAALRSKGIPCAETFRLSECLGDPVQVRAWTIAKLPNDSFSIDNAIMLYNSGRWPLCIDPQRQANKWIRNMESKRAIKAVKQSQANFVRTIESAIQFGTPVLLENVPEVLDPVLEPLLARQIVRVGGVPTIRLGDATVEYDANFRLYITTVLVNPHYPPETCVKVNLLNFMATSDGLQDQMLGIVVKTERPELEEQREKIVLEDAENKRQLKELEDKILALLAASKGNILDDEVLIATLGESKTTSNAIMKQVEIAERTQVKIAAARMGYTPVAKRCSILFFCIADLCNVDPMYQYSLEWYIKLFLMAIDKAPKPEEVPGGGAAAAQLTLDKRLASLMSTFTLCLYENVCRSLFEKDKLLFSLLLATKIMLGDGKLDAGELRFSLQGSIAMTLRKPVPPAARAWLTEKAWGDILELATLPAPCLKGLDARMEGNLGAWEEVFVSVEPLGVIERLMDGHTMTAFQRLCVLRCFRPDKVVPAVQEYIRSELGAQFIDPPTFNLGACYDDSDATAPLVFVLTPGVDPMSELMKLAEKLGKGKKLQSVSLGQGQGVIAERLIAEAIDSGAWVCLQNCHLAESWMPSLERIVEEIKPESTNEEFRLWLTSMPNPKFPVLVLQNSVKMTLEPPKGMRSNIQGSITSLDPDWFEGGTRPAVFKKLVFGLCFLHASLLERKKFGPLGWNIRYDFSDSDLRISLDQVKIFCDDMAYAGADGNDVPFDALTYLTGECNYGGRVTDDNDRRTLMNILGDVYHMDTVRVPSAKMSPSGIYFIPPDGPISSYLDYVRTLPFINAPEVFGMNENADISCAINDTNLLLSTALSLQPRDAGEGGGGGSNPASSFEGILSTLVASISGKIPELFDIEAVAVRFPVSFEESLNTVLVQECMRFNNLTGTVKRTLKEVGLAIKGLSVMSGELEALGQSMVLGKVPDMWKAVAYPSVKPLASWVQDLLDRLTFLQLWIDTKKRPNVFWISGFFFTQSFLTGVRQNYSRRHKIAIDLLTYTYRVLTPSECAKAPSDAPVDGVNVEGLYFQGAAWDVEAGVIGEAKPRELFAKLPTALLLPIKSADIDPKANVYPCPVYKTSERAGLLSTTGHSTNFVMAMSLPIAKDANPRHWVKRGAALFTALDD